MGHSLFCTCTSCGGCKSSALGASPLCKTPVSCVHFPTACQSNPCFTFSTRILLFIQTCQLNFSQFWLFFGGGSLAGHHVNDYVSLSAAARWRAAIVLWAAQVRQTTKFLRGKHFLDKERRKFNYFVISSPEPFLRFCFTFIWKFKDMFWGFYEKSLWAFRLRKLSYSKRNTDIYWYAEH